VFHALDFHFAADRSSAAPPNQAPMVCFKIVANFNLSGLLRGIGV